MKRTVLYLLLIGVLLTVVPATLYAQDSDPTTSVDEEEIPRLDFPLTMPDADLIQQATDCELPFELSEVIEQPGIDEDSTACELATMALFLAFNTREDQDYSSQTIEIYQRAIALNPALAVRLPMLIYFYNTPIVTAPEFTDQAITAMTIHYDFGGLGNSVNYLLEIENADDEPEITAELENINDYADEGEADSPLELTQNTVDADLLQAFSETLVDFVPVANHAQIINCYDYYPDWQIDLTFEDGTQVSLVTNGSNVLGIGGPWQMEIDDQIYVKNTMNLNDAIIALFDALELPFGQTAASTCGGLDDPIYQYFSG